MIALLAFGTRSFILVALIQIVCPRNSCFALGTCYLVLSAGVKVLFGYKTANFDVNDLLFRDANLSRSNYKVNDVSAYSAHSL